MQISSVNSVNFQGTAPSATANSAKEKAYNEYRADVADIKNNVRPETIAVTIAGALATGIAALKSVKFARRAAVAAGSAITNLCAGPAMKLKNHFAKEGKKLSPEQLSEQIATFTAKIPEMKQKLIQSQPSQKFVDFVNNISEDLFGAKGRETATGIMDKLNVKSIDGLAELGVAAVVGNSVIDPTSDAVEGHLDKKSLAEAGSRLVNALNNIEEA